MSVISFKVVKFNNGCFISNTQPYNEYITNLFFDGVKAIPSCKKDWYKLDKVPTKISKQGYATKVNHRYELKDTVTFDLPKVYTRDEFAYYDDDGYWVPRSEFEDVFSLYREVYDVEPGQLEELKFHLDIIANYNCDLIEPNDTNYFNIPYGGSTSNPANAFCIKDKSVEYLLVNELTTPDLYIDNTPCCLSAKQSYEIIRFHIKQNIDNTWASLTDYDFCLSVKRNVKLQEVQTYTAFETLFGRSKKKPKTITKYRDKREITVFECCPSPRDGYTVVTPFKGNNLQDLKDNIDNYLNTLMNDINKPLIDCPHCQGLGVIDYIEN